MADILETAGAGLGGSILGAVGAYFGLERRVTKLETKIDKCITQEQCKSCADNTQEWREDMRNKLDLLINIHLKDGMK